MREETVVVPNNRAEEFDAMAMHSFPNTEWEAESGDFYTTFTVWNVFTGETSDAEVQSFVEAAKNYQ